MQNIGCCKVYSSNSSLKVRYPLQNASSSASAIAEFGPGLITLDGHADDWKDMDGFEFSLLPALDPDAENEYRGGKMTVKALHDGRDVFFMVQVDGDYAYSKGDNNKCPSVALMFQIGEDATYRSMGGCKEGVDSCTNKTCKGHEVDICTSQLGMLFLDSSVVATL
ncbi:uncharacterized protein Pyn_06086 [Prunus yedoensis var. nudiflora]|uniref:Cytochrome c-552/DMSO reductase-like haem-binding domain-containing protein n=1 Tax=Prunus yedoensis var. nudiflora TaxID=2094558 RepID=A0A314XVF3_PRUYE|nr:uncharacterized protein Pyn_06086 [Prunus yedoensis var. nudiflora]